jgi:RNA polymerase sigma-70 factor (ECF subfamily)
MESGDSHLSRIDTQWTLVNNAHGESSDAARQSRHRLLARYGSAAHRYLLRLSRSSAIADDLFQEFAVKVLEGSFRTADADRGRFRDFVKRTLFNLSTDVHRKKSKGAEPLVGDEAIPGGDEAAELERAWNQSRRDAIVHRAKEVLEVIEQSGGPKYFSALRWKIAHPDLDAPILANLMSAGMGKIITPDNLRQLIHRGRAKLADLVVYELRMMLQTDDRHELQQELADLKLLKQCRGALDRALEGKSPGRSN